MWASNGGIFCKLFSLFVLLVFGLCRLLKSHYLYCWYTIMSTKKMVLLNINHGHNNMNILHVKNFWKFNKWESFCGNWRNMMVNTIWGVGLSLPSWITSSQMLVCLERCGGEMWESLIHIGIERNQLKKTSIYQWKLMCMKMKIKMDPMGQIECFNPNVISILKIVVVLDPTWWKLNAKDVVAIKCYLCCGNIIY